MALTAAQLSVKVSADTSQAEKGLHNVGREADNAGGGLKGALKHMLEFAGGQFVFQELSNAVGELTGQVKEFLTAGFDFDSEMEHLHAQLTAITGSGKVADQMTDWIKKFGQTVPDTTEHLAQATVTIQSLGLNAENVMPSIANVAAAMGVDLPTAARAFSDAYEGRFMMMQMDLHLTRKQLEGFGLDSKNLQGTLPKAFEALQKAKFPKGLSAAMGTFQGQVSNLTDRYQMLAGEVMKPVFQGVEKDLLKLFDIMDQNKGTINQVASLIGSVLGNALSTAVTWILRAGQVIGPLFSDIGTAFQPVQQVFKSIQPPLQATSDLFRGVYRNVQPVHQVIKGLQPPLQATSDLFRGVARPVQETSKAIKEANAKFIEAGKQQKLVDFLKQLRDVFIEVAKFVVKDVVPILGKLADWFVKVVLPAVSQFAGFAQSTLIPAIRQIVQWFGKHVLPIVLQVANIFMTDVLPAVEQVAGSIAKNLVPPLEKLWNTLSPLIVPILSYLGWILKNVLGPVLGFIIQVIGGLVDLLANILAPIISNVIVPGFQTMSGVIEWLLGKLGDLLTMLGNLAHGPLIQVGNFINSVSSGVGGAISHLPHFASGGTMPQTGWALVGENGPEIVKLPGATQIYSNPSQVAGAGTPITAGGGGTQTINLVVDGRVLAQVTAKHMPTVIRNATGARQF